MEKSYDLIALQRLLLLQQQAEAIIEERNKIASLSRSINPYTGGFRQQIESPRLFPQQRLPPEYLPVQEINKVLQTRATINQIAMSQIQNHTPFGCTSWNTLQVLSNNPPPLKSDILIPSVLIFPLLSFYNGS